uniref:Uncharacterized protein n=1 Tax=Medicago truncatula TaxID=3880 RepID=I3SN17_MEDTR|nr:unknown [Medicago truncatula]
MINEVSAKFIVSSWNFNNLRRLRRNPSRSHRNTVIKREFLIKHFGEIKTQTLKKLRLQRHHSFAMKFFEGNGTRKVRVINFLINLLVVGGGNRWNHSRHC